MSSEFALIGIAVGFMINTYWAKWRVVQQFFFGVGRISRDIWAGQVIGRGIVNYRACAGADDSSNLDAIGEDMLGGGCAGDIVELGRIGGRGRAIVDYNPFAGNVIFVFVGDRAFDWFGQAVVVIPGIGQGGTLGQEIAILVVGQSGGTDRGGGVRIGIACPLITGVGVTALSGLAGDIADGVIIILFFYTCSRILIT